MIESQQLQSALDQATAFWNEHGDTNSAEVVERLGYEFSDLAYIASSFASSVDEADELPSTLSDERMALVSEIVFGAMLMGILMGKALRD